MVVLDKRQIDTRLLPVALGLKGFQKEPPMVTEYLWLDHHAT
jgi:hypothetical protein